MNTDFRNALGSAVRGFFSDYLNQRRGPEPTHALMPHRIYAELPFVDFRGRLSRNFSLHDPPAVARHKRPSGVSLRSAWIIVQ
jgi:hypothetical protein